MTALAKNYKYAVSHSEICPLQAYSARRPTPAVEQYRSQGQYQENYTYKYTFLVVGEIGVPGVNPSKHGENMQTPHRKALLQLGIKPTIFLTKRVSMWKERICKNVQYMVLYKVAKPLQKEKNVITVIHNRSAEQTIYKNESVQLMR